MESKRKPRALLMKERFTLGGKNIIKLMENSKKESGRSLQFSEEHQHGQPSTLTTKQGKVRSCSAALCHRGTKLAATPDAYKGAGTHKVLDKPPDFITLHVTALKFLQKPASGSQLQVPLQESCSLLSSACYAGCHKLVDKVASLTRGAPKVHAGLHFTALI